MKMYIKMYFKKESNRNAFHPIFYPAVKVYVTMAVPRLRWLVTSLSLWRPRSVHVGFVVDKVALGQDLSKFFSSPVKIIPPGLHTHISLGNEHYADWWLQFRDIVSPHQYE
jgi:hypothetical protein